MNFADETVSLFSAIYITFHAPSEHTYLGQHFDLEMQIYHSKVNETDPAAAISIFFDRKHGGNQVNAFIEMMSFGNTVLGQPVMTADI